MHAAAMPRSHRAREKNRGFMARDYRAVIQFRRGGMPQWVFCKDANL